MLQYDKENIPEKTVKAVNNVFNSPNFSLDAIKSASEALLGICKWAMAMMKYHELLKIVNPKREKVAEMNVMLKEVRARLKEKMDALAKVEEKMALLEATYQEKLAEEAALVAKIEDCNKKLERAGKIIDGLAGEKQRWTDTVARLSGEYEYLVGNSLIAAGMVAYSGPFTAKFRAELEAEWNEKIC
jgi:dynein heavy chain, axonemal